MSDPTPPAIELTPSEQLILDCIRARMPDAEIAVRLGVSMGDAKERIATLIRKLDVVNRAALATWTGVGSSESGGGRTPAEHASVTPSHNRRFIFRAAPALLAVAVVVVVVSWTLLQQTVQGSDFHTIRLKPVETPVLRTLDPTQLARTSLIDLSNADPEAVKELLAAFAGRTDCLEFRPFPNAVEDDCLADGIRLRSLHEWRRVGYRTWEKVETPDGRVGWVDSRYLK